MRAVLPFRLKVAGKDEIDGMSITSMAFRVHGFLQVDGDHLVIEWGGTVTVEEVGMSIRDDTERLPDERLEVPVTDIRRAELAGGWFRPHLRVQARRVGALARVPGEKDGVASFWYDRAERFTAIELARELNDAISAAQEER
jgi:hypothetical protein